MATDIVIPALGESITEGVITSWLVAEGEYVERDQPVLELETDKITMELPAPASGAVSHKAAEGDTVEVGAVVGGIDESAEPSKADSKSESKKDAKAEPKKAEQPASSAKASDTKPGASGAAKAGTAPPADPAKQQLPSRANRGPVGTPPPVLNMPSGPASSGPIDDDDVAATPLARKIAHERSIDLHSITGTGPSGRVREQDVLAFIQSHQNGAHAPASGAAPQAPAHTGGSRNATREKMSPLRQRIASRLVEAQHTAAMLTTFNECDMTNVMALRSRHKEAFAERHGVGLGFMSFFVKAAVSALRNYPLVNSYIVDGEKGPEVQKHDYCDIAVAVGTPKGLVVPVVRNCESRSFADIEQGIKDLATKARDGKLSLEDMQGGTFTISNGGVYGSMMSTPILNPPQSGILGMHNIVRRPVENPDKPGSGDVVVRPMMYLALSYDHRIVDGAEAVGFLKHIKECIEDPARLLFDM
ncbi:MAG: 2-oxoglutarate dehydrogenase complex dihydrolipoyllysine-residue succinyltransferase [Phycisphaerales bacterium]